MINFLYQSETSERTLHVPAQNEPVPERDPTPEEIKERAAMIRSSWTPQEQRRRWTYKPQPMQMLANRVSPME